MKYLLVSLGILLFLAIAENIREMHTFTVTRYQFCSSKRSGLSKELKFVVLADLHNKTYGHENDRLMQAIQKENPDAVLVAGDMLVAKPGKETKTAEALMRVLSAAYPVYYGNGNHEYRLKIYPDRYGNMYGEYSSAIKACGIHLLENEKVEIKIDGTPVTIYGLEIGRNYYKRLKKQHLPENYLQQKLGQVNNDELSILLAHNPDYFDAYADWGADLTLSGHNHGGIVRIPFLGGVISPQVALFPKYSGGCYKKDDKYMILSRGLGSHTIPLRLFNTPELIVFTIVPGAENGKLLEKCKRS